MMDTALMEESLSLLSDSEYDKTGDDLLNSRSRRRSKRKSSRQSGAGPQHVLTDNTLKRYTILPHKLPFPKISIMIYPTTFSMPFS